MIDTAWPEKKRTAPVAATGVAAFGCGISSSYRPTEQKTIRDFSDSSKYRKVIGRFGAFQHYHFQQCAGGGTVYG
jgi:hypothetical protein